MSTTSVILASRIRTEALKMVAAANASHIGGALSVADLLGVLYEDILRFDPENAGWSERDRFILSKGHCCSALYAALALKGFFPMSELASFAQDGSRLLAHASHHVPGVELSTGSLGHGLPAGCGMALAARRDGMSWRTFVLMSDGECDEGTTWEAALFAGHHNLDNLVAIVDCNKLQGLGTTREVLDLEPFADKWRSFKWTVREVDGHHHPQIEHALRGAPEGGKPTVIIAHTVKGKGVSFMENKLEWHYKSPTREQLKQALSELEIA